MPRPQSGSSGPTLRKSQRPCGRLQNCLARRLLAGGVPGPGGWWRDSQKSYITSQQYEIGKNGEKTGGFAHVLAYKSPKTPFFAHKYILNKIYSRDVFLGTHKFLSSLLKPVLSFGSHIRPQPHRLGLRFKGSLSFKLQQTSVSSLSQNYVTYSFQWGTCSK